MKQPKNNTLEIAAPESDYLYVASSLIPDSGMGLFTCINIFKDEVICLFGGEIIGEERAKERIFLNLDQYFISLPNGKYLDSFQSTCFARYANDAKGKYIGSAKNNAKIALNDQEKVCLIATKKIKAGSEIYCTYGKSYWLKHG
ncbi:MAG: SET domain-containing protein [bacterium]|nr:SET domain-containing protein [bacterium]